MSTSNSYLTSVIAVTTFMTVTTSFRFIKTELSVGKCYLNTTKEYGLYASNELSHNDNFKGHHAGGTEEERLIDISIF